MTNPQNPANNLSEFLAWGREKNPLLLGTFGAGSIAHFGAVSFGSAVKLPVETVHYRSTGDAIAGAINGDVHGIFITPALALPQVKGGKLNEGDRQDGRETPGGLPGRGVDEGAGTPAVRAKLEEAGMRVFGSSRDEFAKMIRDDTARWGKVIAASGFKVEE